MNNCKKNSNHLNNRNEDIITVAILVNHQYAVCHMIGPCAAPTTSASASQGIYSESGR